MSWPLTTAIRGVTRRLGYDIIRYQPGTPFSRERTRLIDVHEVSVALDVGAAAGDYATQLRQSGFSGRIVSVEPLSTAFAALAVRTAADPLWQPVHAALGSVPGVGSLRVSALPMSSSLLPMTDRHVVAAPGSSQMANEEVRVDTLDALCDRLSIAGERLFMKLDVQGYELDVIRGGTATAPSIRVLESELSFATLYDGQALFEDMLRELGVLGFSLVALEPAFIDAQTGELLQVNGLFSRIARATGAS